MIPKPIIEVVEAARSTTKAFRTLRAAREHEASEKILADKRKALQGSLLALELRVLALEEKLARAREAAKKPFDWEGLFKVGGKLLDLTIKAKNGTMVKSDVKVVEDIIDAEIVGEPEVRRR